MPKVWTKATNLDNPSCFSKMLSILKIHVMFYPPRRAAKSYQLHEMLFLLCCSHKF